MEQEGENEIRSDIEEKINKNMMHKHDIVRRNPY